MNRALLGAFVLLAACEGLREATVAPDGGATPSSDGGSSVPVVVPDSGTTLTPSDSGVACDGGVCPPEQLATGLIQGTALTVDSNNIYFADHGVQNGSVSQCPKAGCNGAPIVLGAGVPTHIEVANGTVYWANSAAGQISACAIGGCNGAPTALITGELSIDTIATDGTDLFWEAHGAIRRCPLATCSSATTTDILATGVTADSMIASAGSVVWTDKLVQQVLSCPSTGACGTPAVISPFYGVNLSISGPNLYWLQIGTNDVVTCALSGCHQFPALLGTSPEPAHPRSDETDVFWRDDLEFAIVRCPVLGCPASGVEVLATNQHADRDGELAYDDKYIYWTTITSVTRIPK